MKASNKYLRIGSSISLWLFLFVLSGPAVVSYAATAAPANGGMISGWVSSPAGFPLPAGTLVKLFDIDEKTVRGQAIPDGSNGSFQIGPVRNGLYVLKAVPNPLSGFTQSLPEVVSVINAPVNIGELALTTPYIHGVVMAPGGLTPAEAEVFVYLGDGQVLQQVLAPGGSFLIGGLSVGSYALRAFPLGDLPYWKSELTMVQIPGPGEPQTVSLTLRDADLWGTVQDYLGNPVKDARVFASSEGSLAADDLSNPHGFWAIGGLTAGTYQLNALPPWPDSGLLLPQPVFVDLPGAVNPYTLVFGSPSKQVQGSVTTNTGLPVFHAQVLARRVNQPGQAQVLSEASGAYQLDLGPGLWALTAKPITDTLPLDWVYPQSPQFIFFHSDNDPETRQQDFTVLTADATVVGVVQMPDSSVPPFTVTVGLYNDEGVGLRTQIDPSDGSFEAALPSGSYKVAIHPTDLGYVGPAVDPIVVPQNGNFDLGTLTLLPRDAVITGTITSEGSGVAGIPVVAWRPGIPGSLRTASGTGGVYALAVSQGAWHVQPAPGPADPYLYTGDGEDVELLAGCVISDLDFNLLATDATITGALVDEAGAPVFDAHGWADAFQVGAPNIHNGAPIQGGMFTIHVPAGTYKVLADLPAGGPYTSSRERRVTVEAGQNLNITLAVQVKNARIAGALWDPRNQAVVDGVSGLVGAWSGENWAATPINTSNGAYAMGVSAGLWHLNFRIDPTAGYAKISGPMNVPVQAGQTATLPLGIIPKDGKITGSVQSPDGSPLAEALVLAKGIDPLVNDLWLQTKSEADGSFSLAVPYGRYRLEATIYHPEWIKPAERQVFVHKGETSSGHVLQFRLPDVAISGMVTVNHTIKDGEVYMWAWSEDGGFTRGVFPVALNGSQASGSYQLAVVSNTVWNLGAVMETESQYWIGRAQVPLGETGATQDLLLNGPFPKPAPVVVTFDASDPQHIALADGTQIFIPAGAMPVIGQVTLRVVPIASLPHQQHANVLKYGYSFVATDASGQPIEAHFDQDVVIMFSYDEAELNRLHIYEEWLKPAYFSTTTDRWTFPESYVVDIQANRVVMQIDHFTDYALTSLPIFNLYLPITIR